jgi:hypothetical protein
LNPKLVTCLLGSAVIAATSATVVAVCGGGWLMALLAYSGVGSGSLLAATALTLPGVPRRPRPAKLPPAQHAPSTQESRAVA